MGATSPPAPVVPRMPETDWGEVGCPSVCRFEHTLAGLCRYGNLPPRVVERLVSEPVPEQPAVPRPVAWSGVTHDDSAGTGDTERALLLELADLTGKVGPWGAALTVFGGAPVTCGAAGTGPYATQGREPPASVPR
jgi:hypothetical protein